MSLEVKTATSAISSWTLYGVSLTQVNELLSTIALCLTIIATAITIGVWIPKAIQWVKDRAR